MTEYVKKSDVMDIINKYEKIAKKVYKDKPDIKIINIEDLKSDIMMIQTYKGE